MVMERRECPRHEVSLRVDYADARGRAWMGLARSLSKGGMFIEYTPGVSRGETITAAFLLPTGKPCKLQAEVVRTTCVGAGLRFLERQGLDANRSLQRLQAYCRD